jgi:hypothetical protein
MLMKLTAGQKRKANPKEARDQKRTIEKRKGRPKKPKRPKKPRKKIVQTN